MWQELYSGFNMEQAKSASFLNPQGDKDSQGWTEMLVADYPVVVMIFSDKGKGAKEVAYSVE